MAIFAERIAGFDSSFPASGTRLSGHVPKGLPKMFINPIIGAGSK
jgi:hypothetical protein